MFWSETPQRVAPGESLPIHVHSPEEGSIDGRAVALTVRAGKRELVVGLDGDGRGMVRYEPDGEGLLVLSHPGVAHHPVWVGTGDIPEKYRDDAGGLIIPEDEDPGEDPDPALTAPVDSASIADEQDELVLRPGETPITPPGLDAEVGGTPN